MVRSSLARAVTGVPSGPSALLLSAGLGRFPSVQALAFRGARAREGVPASRPAWERGLNAGERAAREPVARLFQEWCAHVLPAGFSVPENRA